MTKGNIVYFKDLKELKSKISTISTENNIIANNTINSKAKNTITKNGDLTIRTNFSNKENNNSYVNHSKLSSNGVLLNSNNNVVKKFSSSSNKKNEPPKLISKHTSFTIDKQPLINKLNLTQHSSMKSQSYVINKVEVVRNLKNSNMNKRYSSLTANKPKTIQKLSSVNIENYTQKLLNNRLNKKTFKLKDFYLKERKLSEQVNISNTSNNNSNNDDYFLYQSYQSRKSNHNSNSNPNKIRQENRRIRENNNNDNENDNIVSDNTSIHDINNKEADEDLIMISDNDEELINKIVGAEEIINSNINNIISNREDNTVEKLTPRCYNYKYNNNNSSSYNNNDISNLSSISQTIQHNNIVHNKHNKQSSVDYRFLTDSNWKPKSKYQIFKTSISRFTNIQRNMKLSIEQTQSTSPIKLNKKDSITIANQSFKNLTSNSVLKESLNNDNNNNSNVSNNGNYKALYNNKSSSLLVDHNLLSFDNLKNKSYLVKELNSRYINFGLSSLDKKNYQYKKNAIQDLSELLNKKENLEKSNKEKEEETGYLTRKKELENKATSNLNHTELMTLLSQSKYSISISKKIINDYIIEIIEKIIENKLNINKLELNNEEGRLFFVILNGTVMNSKEFINGKFIKHEYSIDKLNKNRKNTKNDNKEIDKYSNFDKYDKLPYFNSSLNKEHLRTNSKAHKIFNYINEKNRGIKTVVYNHFLDKCTKAFQLNIGVNNLFDLNGNPVYDLEKHESNFLLASTTNVFSGISLPYKLKETIIDIKLKSYSHENLMSIEENVLKEIINNNPNEFIEFQRNIKNMIETKLETEEFNKRKKKNYLKRVFGNKKKRKEAEEKKKKIIAARLALPYLIISREEILDYKIEYVKEIIQWQLSSYNDTDLVYKSSNHITKNKSNNYNYNHDYNYNSYNNYNYINNNNNLHSANSGFNLKISNSNVNLSNNSTLKLNYINSLNSNSKVNNLNINSLGKNSQEELSNLKIKENDNQNNRSNSKIHTKSSFKKDTVFSFNNQKVIINSNDYNNENNQYNKSKLGFFNDTAQSLKNNKLLENDNNNCFENEIDNENTHSNTVNIKKLCSNSVANNLKQKSFLHKSTSKKTPFQYEIHIDLKKDRNRSGSDYNNTYSNSNKNFNNDFVLSQVREKPSSLNFLYTDDNFIAKTIKTKDNNNYNNNDNESNNDTPNPFINTNRLTTQSQNSVSQRLKINKLSTNKNLNVDMKNSNYFNNKIDKSTINSKYSFRSTSKPVSVKLIETNRFKTKQVLDSERKYTNLLGSISDAEIEIALQSDEEFLYLSDDNISNVLAENKLGKKYLTRLNTMIIKNSGIISRSVIVSNRKNKVNQAQINNNENNENINNNDINDIIKEENANANINSNINSNFNSHCISEKCSVNDSNKSSINNSIILQTPIQTQHRTIKSNLRAKNDIISSNNNLTINNILINSNKINLNNYNFNTSKKALTNNKSLPSISASINYNNTSMNDNVTLTNISQLSKHLSVNKKMKYKQKLKYEKMIQNTLEKYKQKLFSEQTKQNNLLSLLIKSTSDESNIYSTSFSPLNSKIFLEKDYDVLSVNTKLNRENQNSNNIAAYIDILDFYFDTKLNRLETKLNFQNETDISYIPLLPQKKSKLNLVSRIKQIHRKRLEDVTLKIYLSKKKSKKQVFNLISMNSMINNTPNNLNISYTNNMLLSENKSFINMHKPSNKNTGFNTININNDLGLVHKMNKMKTTKLLAFRDNNRLSSMNNLSLTDNKNNLTINLTKAGDYERNSTMNYFDNSNCNNNNNYFRNTSMHNKSTKSNNFNYSPFKKFSDFPTKLYREREDDTANSNINNSTYNNINNKNDYTNTPTANNNNNNNESFNSFKNNNSIDKIERINTIPYINTNASNMTSTKEKKETQDYLINLIDKYYQKKKNQYPSKEAQLASMKINLTSINDEEVDDEHKDHKDQKEQKSNSLIDGVMKSWIKKVELIHKFSDLDLDEDALGHNNIKDYIKVNIKSNTELYYNASKMVEKALPDLLHLNIPKIQKCYPHLTRKTLYEIFCQFKSLMKLSIVLNKNVDQIKKGIDFNTFKYGVRQMMTESVELAKQIFDVINSSKSGYLSYDEFMKGMIILKSKNIEDKVNLFFKIIDSDGNGLLSYEEVEVLSYKSLKRSLATKINEDPKVLRILAKCFASKIFDMVDADEDSEITLGELQKKFFVKGEEAEYLEMFCCADLN